jgi:lycopene beta-cyclase
VALLDADVVVCGAGAAGLSIAVRLARLPLTVCLLDRREGYGRDRTFSFFRGRSHPFEDAVTRRYKAIDVVGQGRRVARNVEARPYETLPSDRFYESALRTLARHDRVRLELGVTVGAIRDLGAHVEIETDRGALRAALLIDARGAIGAPSTREGDVHWVQHFAGMEVEVDNPIFEPAVATLMDLRVSQADGPHFVYVLPETPRRALVEDTFFGPKPFEIARYGANVRAWLEARGAGAVKVLAHERGVLPMTTADVDRGKGRILRVGLAGGAAKPSTGYAFTFIQRDADAIGHALAGWDRQKTPVIPAPRSATSLFFDRVFLAYLAAHPHDAERVFLDLFAGTSGPGIARFLSEDATAGDYAAVMAAVPSGGVLAQAIRSRDLWMR